MGILGGKIHEKRLFLIMRLQNFNGRFSVRKLSLTKKQQRKLINKSSEIERLKIQRHHRISAVFIENWLETIFSLIPVVEANFIVKNSRRLMSKVVLFGSQKSKKRIKTSFGWSVF